MSHLLRSRQRTRLAALATVVAGAAIVLPAANAAADPVVTAISSKVAIVLGSSLTVSGNGFTGATKVTLGSNGALSFSVVDDHTIKASWARGLPPGTFDVQVTAGGVTSATSSLDQLRLVLGPDLGRQASVPVTCTLGAATFAATLNTEFVDRTRHLSAGSASPLGALSADLYVPDTSALTANPQGQPVGNATVTSFDADVTGATTSTIDLSAVSPNQPFLVGTTQSSNPMDFTIASEPSSSLVATGATSPVTVSLHGYHAKVTLDGGGSPVVASLDCLPSSTAPVIETYPVDQPAPEVTSIDTTTGPTTGGTVINVSGSHLANTTAVGFGPNTRADQPPLPVASYTVVSDSLIKVTTAAHLPGTEPIAVTNSGGSSTDSPTFTFVGSAPSAPVTVTAQPVCTFTPTIGAPVQTQPTVTLSGSAPASVRNGEPAGLTGVTASFAFSAADAAKLHQLAQGIGIAPNLSATVSGTTSTTAATNALTTTGSTVDLTSDQAFSFDETLDDLNLGITNAAPGRAVVASNLVFTDHILLTGAVGTLGSNPTAVSCSPATPSISIPVVADPNQPVGIAASLKGAATLKTLAKGSVPLTGSLTGSAVNGAFSGDLALDATTAKLVALGFLPVTAKLTFTESGSTTGTLGDGAITLHSKLRIRLPSVSLLGVALTSGGNCQAAQLSPVTLTSNAFTPSVGGTLSGAFSISNLSGCGVLNGLVSSLTSGGGNALTLTATAAPR